MIQPSSDTVLDIIVAARVIRLPEATTEHFQSRVTTAGTQWKGRDGQRPADKS